MQKPLNHHLWKQKNPFQKRLQQFQMEQEIYQAPGANKDWMQFGDKKKTLNFFKWQPR